MVHEEQISLLAHCVSLGVNALFEATKGYDGRISAHGVAQRIIAQLHGADRNRFIEG